MKLQHFFSGKQRQFLLCLIFFLYANVHFATLSYSLNVSTPGYTAITGSVVPNFNNVCEGAMVSASYSIGFTFVYDGISYSQFQVSDNGELFLGASYTCNDNCGGSCNFSEKEPADLASGTDRPAICPLWDDLGFVNNGAAVTFTTTGSGSNHVLTVQWTLMNWKYNNTTGATRGGISFQVKLYESPAGQIDFVYKQESQLMGTGLQAPHARIGLMGASGDYYSTDQTGVTPSKITQYTVTAKPADGAQLRWTIPAVLPVALLYFKAKKLLDNEVALDWQTATETNNKVFTIYRGIDGIRFDAIAEVKGAGNSLTLKSYNYTDRPDSSDIFYYRLMQTDFNGQSSYSDITQIKLDTKRPPGIYFNAAAGQLIIKCNFSKEEFIRLEIFDITGKSVYMKQDNIPPAAENAFMLSLPAEGVYFARLSGKDGNLLCQSKFLKP